MDSKHLATIVQKTIFVVDDDSSMRLGVKRLLNKHGFETELFDSVEDFHERADVRRPDCLVLDVKLKNGSGIDLRRELTNSGVSGYRPHPKSGGGRRLRRLPHEAIFRQNFDRCH